MNIPTNHALLYIHKFLKDYALLQNQKYPTKAVTDGLWLIMKNNVFTLNDCTFLQLNGTAMGKPHPPPTPVPPYANLHFALKKMKLQKKYKK